MERAELDRCLAEDVAAFNALCRDAGVAADVAILVLPTTSWPRMQRHAAEVAGDVATMRPGEYRELAG